jgi:hypothetical protein
MVGISDLAQEAKGGFPEEAPLRLPCESEMQEDEAKAKRSIHPQGVMEEDWTLCTDKYVQSFGDRKDPLPCPQDRASGVH